MTDKDRNVVQTNPNSPKTDVFGKEALTNVLSTVTFPTTKPELIKHIGNQKIEYLKGHPVRLEDIINQCNCNKFDSRNEVVTAMCQFLENRTEQEKSSSKKV